MQVLQKPPEGFVLQPLSRQHLLPLAAIAALAPDVWQRQDLEAALQDEHRLCIVALQGDTPKAFACFRHLFEDAELEMVVCAEDVRRQGVAKQLLLQGMEQLKQQGVRQVLLELRVSNRAAQALYEELGFCTLAQRPRLYNNPPEDGITMKRDL